MNKFLKLIGYQHNYGGRDRSYKFSWGEIALWTKNLGIHWSGGEYCYEPKLVIQAYFINAYIPTWSFGVKPGEFGVPETRFGFYLYSSLHNWNSTVFFFGKWSKHVDMPWTYEWERTELLDWNMQTVCEEVVGKRDWDKWYKETEAWVKDNAKTFDYTYVLKNGTVQNRKATCHIERRTWKIRWAPWVKNIRTTLEVAFNDEVGERTGTWKGGTIGTSCELLPNETPEQALRRMEKEEKFE